MAFDSDLIERSMALSPAERADLAEHLLASLHEDGPDPALDPLWLAEFETRMGRYRRGETSATDWKVVQQLHNDRLPHPSNLLPTVRPA